MISAGYAATDPQQRQPQTQPYGGLSQTQPQAAPQQPQYGIQNGAPRVSSPYSGYWQPPRPAGGYPGPSWQPQQQAQQGPSSLPSMPAPQQVQQNQSLEQQALAGGTNAQQTQNFIQALRASGAGSNNQFANAGGPIQAQQPQLLGNLPGSNGSAGSAQYVGGFNQGMAQVSYNGNLGAQFPGAGSLGALQGATWGRPQPQYGVSNGPPQVGALNGGFNISNGPNPVSQTTPYTGTLQGRGIMQQPQIQQAMPYSNLMLSPGATQGATAIENLGAQQFTPQQGGLAGLVQPMISPLQGLIMSDENQKTDIEPAKLQKFLDSIHAWEYEYRDKKHGEGRFVSPMAQELEQTEIGRSAVINTPEGKMVHYGRLEGVALASAAMLNERLNAVEEKMRERLGDG